MQDTKHSKHGKGIRRAAVIATATAMLAGIGFLSASSMASSGSQSSASVSLRKTKLGMILVNSRGRTLYLYGKDRNDKSSCTSSCAKFWPPLLAVGKPTAGTGVKASLLGTTKRSNGSRQVTYNRHPLYTFSLDKQSGQTNGEGSFAFGAKWWALSAKGTAVLKAAGGTTTPYTTTTTPGYTNPYPTP